MAGTKVKVKVTQGKSTVSPHETNFFSTTWWWIKVIILGLLVFGNYFIRSTSKSRPNNIRGGDVRPYVRPSVHKSFFDLNEIWYIGRGRWLMHDGMPYSRIQGLCIYIFIYFKGSWPRSRAIESLNSFHFQNLSPPPFTMGAGKWPLILKLEHNI